MKLELGCGNAKKKGFYGIDLLKYPCVDKVWDLNKGIPLKNNTVSEIYTAHFLEHIDDLNFMVEEMYRVCKNKARILIRVPHFTTNTYEQHKRNFRYNSLRDYEAAFPGYFKPYFKAVKRKLVFGGFYRPFQFLNLIPYVYENTFIRSFVFCSEVIILLEVIK
ncbi:MAG: hypothetical protein KKE20_03820 [Nanoarchaeota archaeon]|nr:hypothetical protein [Nanoarchaeota archaeon]